MRVLTLNAGSSSLKASLVEGDDTITQTSSPWDAERADTVRHVLDAFRGHHPGAVVHRIVHGGEKLTAPVIVDDAVVRAIAAVGELAPLHNDIALDTLRASRSVLNELPHVACFDTAFHATLPEPAFRYPVPTAWWRWGIRRFGFHGLSVEWNVHRAGELLHQDPNDLGLIIAHLGSGCSVTSVWAGRSVWTSMGFTPLDGLMMRTRSGAIDPGIIFHLLRRGHLDLEALAAELEHSAGLAGVGGHDGDVRALEAATATGDDDAKLSLEMFTARVAAGIAAAATWLPRIDAIVFTGGIGENAGRVRARIVGRLRALGAAPIAQVETGQDRILGDGAVKTLRVEAREDLVMARAAVRLLGTRPD
jgi:acetate kinase